MKPGTRRVAVSFGWLVLACATCSPSASGVVIVGVTIVDVETGALSPATDVVIRGDRITAVGPAGSVAMAAWDVTPDGRRFLMVQTVRESR